MIVHIYIHTYYSRKAIEPRAAFLYVAYFGAKGKKKKKPIFNQDEKCDR